jgi:multidrug efflux system membrane fusion protein
MKKFVAFWVFLGVLAWGGYAYISDDQPPEARIETAAGGEAPGGAPQAMPVPVMTVQSEPVQIWHEFSGNLVAVERVEIRPHVSGAIDEVYFTPGSIVEKGDKLFLIDPRPYQAEVNRLAADVAVTKTQHDLAKTEADRAERLLKDNAVSQRSYDERQNAYKVAAANIKAAEAALQQARLNLDYATIKAPVRGTISRAEITEGNIVEAGGNAPLLATLVSTDPIYADFEIDEQTYLAQIRNLNAQEGQEIPVELTLQSDASVTFQGKIVSFDNKLNPATGTLRARGIFPNPDSILVPGMFSKIRLGSAEKRDTILVPESVIGTDQDKRILYVVNDKNTLEYREVKLGGMANGMRIVISGVTAGEKIVTNGLQRLRPGMEVVPQETQALTPQEQPAANPSAEAPAQAEALQEPAAPESAPAQE